MQATNAASSGVKIAPQTLKVLNQRSDGPGLAYLAVWLLVLLAFGALVALARGSVWVWAALVPYGIALMVPTYALSHETAHKTAFKTRWLNEAVFYLTSWLYGEEPIHRRYSHINHHQATWYIGQDSQMPFDTPMGLDGWLLEASGWGLRRFQAEVTLRLLVGRPSPMMRAVIPATQWRAARRNQAIFVAAYLFLCVTLALGYGWPLWFLILPNLIGTPVMLAFTLLQHAELQEDDPDIRKSTRSFRGSWWASFLYMNMENHVEHHLYSSIPFYALPKLRAALGDQIPGCDPGFLVSTWDVLSVVTRRSLGKSTKARRIRQAPHMITEGGPIRKIASRTM